MLPFRNFDLIIFDCDGVLLDSNTLKIEAMGEALKKMGVSLKEVDTCKSFFADNFGKSRFYHVDYFVENLLKVDTQSIDNFKQELLNTYSQQCKKLYLTANITPFSEKLLAQNTAIKYVASGSEQNELREIFKIRKLDSYFSGILGSPEKKSVHIATILKKHNTPKAVMIGDAISDLEAAKENNIDFIFYSPFSNVEAKMRHLCLINGYRIINSFKEVLQEI